MNTVFLHNLLLSLTMQGFLWTLLIWLACFGGVYVATLARLGWEHKNDSSSAKEPQKAEKKTPAEKPQEPIYYIVEKKKRRPKSDYGEPKPFEFKSG